MRIINTNHSPGAIMRFVGVLLFTVFFAGSANAALSGTYTINPAGAASSSNYKTFASAVSDLVSGTRADGGTPNGSGVSGAVIFNVSNGTYTEQITIPAITGTSATNRITFQSASGDSSKVILTQASSTASTNNYTLQLNGADYITFQKITISRTGTSTYGRVIEINNASSYNRFLNISVLGTVQTTSSSTNFTLVYSASGTQDHYNTFRNSLFKYGSYGFYYFGSSTSSREKGTVLENNIFDSTSYHSVQIENQDSAQILGNLVRNQTGTSMFGMNLRYFFDGSTVQKNKIYMNAGSKGLHMEYANSNASTFNPVYVINNFISIGGTSSGARGFDVDYGKNMKIYHNSILMYNTSATSSAVYLWSGTTSSYGGIVLKNNIFANTGGGYALNITTAAAGLPYVDSSDYNNFYTTGSVLAVWGATSASDLSALQTASGKDANSFSTNPRFVSNTDLHSGALALDGAAVNLSVYDDIDGQVRASNPDIGADEYTLPTNDIGISLVVNPVAGVCAGTQDIILRIRNYGVNDIDSFRITYSLDGVTQSTTKSTTTILPDDYTDITVGSISLSSTIKVLKAYTSTPSGKSDLNKLNDTIAANLQASLKGTYTIGTGKDYSNFTAAVNDLKVRGVCGAVTFEVENGTYNEQISIPPIVGSSASNTITFKSKSADSSKVILTFQSTATANNYVVQLNGADYVTFRQISMFNTSTSSSYGRVVELLLGAHQNTFTGNYLQGYKSTSASNARALIYSPSDKDTSNTFTGNYFKYGGYGIYLLGSTANIERGYVVANNIFDSIYDDNIYLTYKLAPVVTGNIISNVGNTANGIYLSNISENATVTQNKIISNLLGYGIYINSSIATSSARSLIANNFVSFAGTAGTAGVYLNTSQYYDVFYNSVWIRSSSTTARALYVNASSSTSPAGNHRLYNNIFANTGGGLAMEVTANAVTTNQIDTSDYNNIYATGTNLVKLGATNYTSLGAYQTASNQDPNSLSVDPKFKSITDLHSTSTVLDGSATPLTSVTTDIDNQARSTTIPDIGADEYTVPTLEAALLGFISPVNGGCAGNYDIKVRVSNDGKNKIDSLYITLVKNGSVVSTTKYTVSLTTDQQTDITLATNTALDDDTLNLVAYITKVNNSSLDNIQTTDTARVIAQAAMAGTYTIGSSGDFASFSDAVENLVGRGVCAAVTFNVSDGTYNEQVSIPQITGASATNTITFKSNSADSSKVKLQFASNSTNNYVLQLNGADNVTFRQISILNASTTSGTSRVVDIRAGANNNTFTGNRLVGFYATSTSTGAALVYSQTDKDSGNVFTRNYFKYGSSALYLLGSSTNREAGLRVENNILDSVYYHQIYTDYQVGPIITGNISAYAGSASAYGIYLGNTSGAAQVLRNNITSNLLGYGIYVSSGIATSSSRALVANNMISFGGTAGTAGIYLTTSQYYDVFYNSVWIRSSSTTARAIYVNASSSTSPAGNHRLYNNIFANTGGGLAMEVTANAVTTNQIDTSDYNNIYATGTNLVKLGATNYSTLSTYQAASNQDPNSISVDPRFKSATDLHVLSISGVSNIGTPLTSVTTDIDGDTRSATPDIGADEFTPLSNDLRILSVIQPESGQCGDSATVVGVVVENIGTSSQSSFAVGATVQGPNGSTSLTQTSSTTIASAAIDTVYFTSTVNTYKGGNFNFEAYTNLSNDADRSNDTLNTTVDIDGIPDVPDATDVIICGRGTATFEVGNAGTDAVNWYATATSTTPIATGETFTTPVLAADSTFYVGLGGQAKFTVGPKDSTIGAGAYSSAGQTTNFDALGDFVLDSGIIYLSAAGTFTFNVLNSSNAVIATKTITVSKAGKQMVSLGFSIPKGTGYKLQRTGTVTLFRNSAGASFPYTVNNVVSLTGTSFDANSFYWLYNWYITGGSCEGPRKAVLANVVDPVSGADITKGTTFNGTFNAGTSANPDVVCPENTLSYEIKTPTGFTNNGYNTAWTFTYNVSTASGTISNDTVRTVPASTNNATVSFTPAPGLSDSTVILTVTAIDLTTGCDTVMMRYIHILPAPKIAFSAADVCDGNAVIFVNNTTLSSGTVSYKWYFGDGSTSTDSAATHTYSAAGTYTVSLVATNTNACKDSVSEQVTVHPVPNAAFTANNGCVNNAVSFTNSSTVATGTLSYLWTFGDGTSSTDENPSKAFSGTGTYGVKLVVTGNGGCKDSATQSVTINAIPQTGFTKGSVFNGIFNSGTASNPDVVCALYTISYDLTTPTGYSNADYGTTWEISQLSFQTANGTAAADTTVTLPSSTSNGKIVFAPEFNTADSTFTLRATIRNKSTGCDTTIVRYVSVLSAPDADFSVNNACAGEIVSFTDESVIGGGTGSYKWYFGDANNSTSTSQSPAFTYTTAGTYTVSLVVAVGSGCNDSITKTVTIYPRATPGFTFVAGCMDSAVVFTNTTSAGSATVSSYLWSFGDGSTSSSTSPSKTYSAAGTYTVKLLVTTSNGCKDSVSKSITVNPLPKPAFTFTSRCADSSISFTNSSTIASGSIAGYLWKFGDGTTSTATAPNKTYSAAGNYTVTLIATSNNGCKDSVKQSVTVYPKPAASFSASSSCVGSIASFTNSSTIATGGTIASYLWRFGDGTTSTAANPAKTYSTTGTYTVTLIVTSARGCVDSVKKTISITPKPTPNFTFSNRCLDSTISFTNTSTIASGSIASYLWRFGDGTTSTSASPTKTYAAAGTYSVRLIATSDIGCKDSVTKTVTVYPKPVAKFSVSNTCIYNAASFTSTSTVSSGSIVSYFWRFGDGTTSTSANPTKTYSAAGTFNVTLKITTNNGCVDSTVVQNAVTIYPKPAANFTYLQRCQDSATSFTNTSTVSSGLITASLWSFGDGGTSTDKNPDYTYASVGTYTVKLVVTTNNGCKDSITKTVTVYPKANVSIGMPTIACANDSVSFSNNSTIATGYSIIGQTWSFGDGGTSTAKNPSHKYAAAGKYNVTLSVKTANGCVSAQTVSVTINAVPQTSFTATTVCETGTSVFTNTTAAPSQGVLNYAWTFGDGGTSTAKNPSHKYVAGGKYDVRLIVTNASGCSDTMESTIRVNFKPLAAFTLPKGCAGQVLSFSDNSSIGGDSIASYAWTFGDGGTSNAKNPTHAYTGPGVFNVRLIVTSDKGCSDTVSSNITVFNTPLAGFTATTECEGGATKFTNTYSSSIFTYKWMFGDGDSSAAENPAHIYAAAGTYQVIFTVTNNNGCATTVTKAVTVNAKPVASFTTQNECFGNVAGFVNTSTVNGDSIISYAWNFGDGQTSTAMEPTHNYSAAGTYTVTLRVATATCSDTVSQTITIYNKPVAAFTAADVCIGNATQFTNNSTVANDSFAAYVWTFGNGDTSTASNPTYTYAAAGTYNVTLYVLSASGCLDSVSRQVKVNALPSLTVTHTTSERNAKFTVSDSSFTSYAWTFGDGGTSTAKNPMHRYPDTGRYNVTVVVRNASGCEATFTDTVHIFSNSIKPAHIATGFNVDIYPNPFKEFTTLTYNLSKPATVRAAVYDMRGREVTVLVDNVQQMAGKYTQTIQPEQSQIKSGVYMLRVVVDGLPVTKQIIRVQ